MFNYLLAFLALGVSLQLALAADEFNLVVQLKHGKVKGNLVQVDNAFKMEFFQGIKYGQAGRFEKPRAVHPWTYVYPATLPRADCPQFGFLPANETVNMRQTASEDCLYLNLWRPTEEKKNRTVMLFIHGGGFEEGTVFSETLDGLYLAHAGDLIVITINYRLGPLGFLNGPGITANLGLHDQIFALKWVQENIAAFGGNPADVTIFGESAGSMSVGALVLSPLAKGLFHRAILQSGSPLGVTFDSPTSGAEKVKAFALRASCQVKSGASSFNETITCLKGKRLTELQVAAADESLFPIFGDEVLPLKPSVALQTGAFNDVDLLYGVNRDEGTSFAAYLVPDLLHNRALTPLSAKRDIEELIKNFNFSESGTHEIADFYLKQIQSASPSQDELKVAISNVWGDIVLVCPTILFGEELARHSHRRQYAYRLMQLLPDADWMGVTHDQDLLYLLAPRLLQPDPSLSGLSQQMIHAWASFAKTGVPSSMGGHVWKEAVNQKTADYHTRYMHLEVDKYKMVEGVFKDTCERFWKAKLFA